MKLPRTSRGSFCMSSTVYWGFALIIAALYTLLTYSVPLLLDDYAFTGIWRDDIPGGLELTWAKVWRFREFISAYDNGRISNVLDPIVCLISPWKEIFPFLNGLMMAWMIIAAQRLVCRGNSAPYLVLVWGLIILSLPFDDSLFVRDYALNYTWSAGVTLAFLFILRSGEKGGWTAPRLILAVILAFLAGGWHESFAVETICGLGLLILVRKFRFSPQFYVIVAVYIAATLLFMLTPGMTGRIHDNSHLRPRHLDYITYHGIIIILCLMGLVYLVIPKWRKRMMTAFSSTTVLVALGILISGYPVASFTVNTPRAYFWPNLAAVVLTLRLFYLAAGPIRCNAWKFGVSLFVGGLCIAQTIYVIIWQRRYFRETEKIISLFDKSESGTVFYDLTLPIYAPHFTRGVPLAITWMNAWQYGLMQSYYLTPTMAVIPTALEYATLEGGEPITGDITGRLYKGNIITAYRQLDPDSSLKLPEFQQAVKVVLPDTTYSKDFLAMPFVTLRGDTLLYYAPF